MGLFDRPVLEGKRIALVPLEKHHLNKRVEFINDPEVQKTLNFNYPTSAAKTEAWFQKSVLSPNRVDFSVESMQEGGIIGFGGYLNIDPAARKAELYIFIGDKRFWGGGYGRDGYKLIVNYGFCELGLERVYLYQLMSNTRAVKATDALGWTTEGVLRKSVFSHGELKDQCIASILRDEWVRNKDYANV